MSIEGGKKTVWVTGASSQLGVFLLPRLTAAGYRVRAVSRQAPEQPLAVDPAVLWMRPEEALALQSGSRAGQGEDADLVSAGPLELAEALLRGGPVRRVVAFSTSSVHSKPDSPDAREREEISGIAEAEARLRDRCNRLGLPLLLIRPTLIWGCGRDRNVSLLARLGRRFRLIPVAGRAAGRRQPVHADDLAALAVAALGAEPAPDFNSPACGGSVLTYREMVEAIAALPSVRARVLAFPPGLFGAAVRVAALWPKWRGLSVEMVRRQGRDLVFDDSALRERLDWSPRPFEPREIDFSVPEPCRRLQLP